MSDEYDEDCGPDIRVLSEGTPVARHGHACKDCPDGCYISAGSRYRKAVLIVDGEFTIDRTCLDQGCHTPQAEAARTRFIAEHDRAVAAGDLPF